MKTKEKPPRKGHEGKIFKSKEKHFSTGRKTANKDTPAVIVKDYGNKLAVAKISSIASKSGKDKPDRILKRNKGELLELKGKYPNTIDRKSGISNVVTTKSKTDKTTFKFGDDKFQKNKKGKVIHDDLNVRDWNKLKSRERKKGYK